MVLGAGVLLLLLTRPPVADVLWCRCRVTRSSRDSSISPCMPWARGVRGAPGAGGGGGGGWRRLAEASAPASARTCVATSVVVVVVLPTSLALPSLLLASPRCAVPPPVFPYMGMLRIGGLGKRPTLDPLTLLSSRPPASVPLVRRRGLLGSLVAIWGMALGTRASTPRCGMTIGSASCSIASSGSHETLTSCARMTPSTSRTRCMTSRLPPRPRGALITTWRWRPVAGHYITLSMTRLVTMTG